MTSSGFPGDTTEVDHSELVGAVDSKMFEEVFSPPARGMDQDMGLFGHAAFDLDLDCTDRVDDPFSHDNLVKCPSTTTTTAFSSPLRHSERANHSDLLQFNGLISADLLEGISATSRDELLSMFETSVKSFQAVSCPTSPWQNSSHVRESRASLIRPKSSLRRILPTYQSDSSSCRNITSTSRRLFSSSCPGSPSRSSSRKSSVPAGSSLLKPSVVSAIRQKVAAATAARAERCQSKRSRPAAAAASASAARPRQVRGIVRQSSAAVPRVPHHQSVSPKHVEVDDLTASKTTTYAVSNYSQSSERVEVCTTNSDINDGAWSCDVTGDMKSSFESNRSVAHSCGYKNMFLSSVNDVTDLSTSFIDEVGDVFPSFVQEIDCLTANELSSLTFESDSVESTAKESSMANTVVGGSEGLSITSAPFDHDRLVLPGDHLLADQADDQVLTVSGLSGVAREEEVGEEMLDISNVVPTADEEPQEEEIEGEEAEPTNTDCISTEEVQEELIEVEEIESASSDLQEVRNETACGVRSDESADVSPARARSPSCLGKAETFSELIEQLQQRLAQATARHERELIAGELSRVTTRLDAVRRHARRITRRLGRSKLPVRNELHQLPTTPPQAGVDVGPQCDDLSEQQRCTANDAILSDSLAVEKTPQKSCSEGVMAEHSYSSKKASESSTESPVANSTTVADSFPPVDPFPSNPTVKRKISFTEYKKRSRNSAAQTPFSEPTNEPLNTVLPSFAPPTSDSETNQLVAAITDSAPSLPSSALFDVPAEPPTAGSFCDPTAVFEQLEAGSMGELLESIMCASPPRVSPSETAECSTSTKIDCSDTDCMIVSSGESSTVLSANYVDSGVSVCGSVCSGSSVKSGGYVDSSVSVCDSMSSGSPCPSDLFVCQQPNQRGRDRERGKDRQSHRRRSRSPCYRRSRSRSRSPVSRRRRHSRSRSRSRRRRAHSGSREQQREALQRRVVYVNGLSAGISEERLHAMFRRHGHITRIKIKQRCASNVYGEEAADCYAFVTFASQRSAVEAQHHGSKEFPYLDVRFGGRREFCLDQFPEPGGLDSYSSLNSNQIDFDTLLQMEMERVQRKRSS